MTADLEQWQAEGGIHPVEKARDQLTYRFVCPVCGAVPGRPCHYPWGGNSFTHTGRYQLAATAGLVPPLGRTRADQVEPRARQ
jgi:hypothetical protein